VGKQPELKMKFSVALLGRIEERAIKESEKLMKM
jgi:hypothetical protein